ncbi:SDR family oxidoreductase [Fischerella sp. PCC 9605]|uniref:SDR family oxidoreductase n=1 Tax=Fischerella sp. PCC 9605 TaxID=1173024 RepID=UPI0004B869BB|nr:SDR family oxidoreductase [Fischerella sp. PCC 9605]
MKLGKHALITGSSRGIGRAIAIKLAKHGVNIAIHYYKNEEAANDTLLKLREQGADGFLVQADVSNPEDISRMFNQVQDKFGKLDIFVSNARPDMSAFYHSPMEITLDHWRAALDSQAQAFLLGTQKAARLMLDGGRIIAITYSPSGRTG